MQGVVFGDVAALVIGWVNPRLAAAGHAARAGRVVRNPRPATFVTVQRTGGPRLTPVSEAAQITVDAWANNTEAAHDLSQLVRAFIHQMRGEVVDGVQVYDVDEFGGPADLPDPTSEQARYTFTLSITLRYRSIIPA